jgi:hypothetical protein
LDAFAERTKHKQRTAPTLALTAGKAKGGFAPPPFFDEFEFFAWKKADSGSCKMAAAIWPFFF